MANLEFKRFFDDGNETHFKKMIQASLFRYGSNRVKEELIHLFGYEYKAHIEDKKLTLRNDTKNSWHSGKSIHFVQEGVLFAPTVAARVDFLRVRFSGEKVEMVIDDWRLTNRNISKLIEFDGFDDREAFFNYHFDLSESNEFHKTMIIWTNLKL